MKVDLVFNPSRQCHGKRQYARRRDALRALKGMQTAGMGRGIVIYRCAHCGFHHLGTDASGWVR